jgi:magnesium transporter
MNTGKPTSSTTTHHQVLNRKKTDPGKFIYTGDYLSEDIDMQLFKYNKTECIETQINTPDDLEEFSQPEFQYWLNIHGLSNTETIALVSKRLNIHDLVIQDILDVNQRPKYQEFDDFVFCTIKSIVPSDKELISEHISFIIGKNHLVSFQEKKADYFEHLRFRLRENTGILRDRASDYLLFTMLESILDNYFVTLQKLEDDIEKLNLFNLNSEPSPNVFRQIEQMKKHVHAIRKAILPIREFTLFVEREKNSYIEKRHVKYFQEIKDLCLTLTDTCDTIEHSLESSTNLFFSIQGHRMNLVMKTLTIVASIFIPLTFITGIYGMNFVNMPELHWKYGYGAVWVLILAVFFTMVVFLRKRRWF